MSTHAIRGRIVRHVTEVRGKPATCGLVVDDEDDGIVAWVCAGDWSLERTGSTEAEAFASIEDALAVAEEKRCGRADGPVATAAEFRRGYAHEARV